MILFLSLTIDKFPAPNSAVISIPCSPNNIEQFLWVEGSSQVALALNFITDSDTGELTNSDEITFLNTNIQKGATPLRWVSHAFRRAI